LLANRSMNRICKLQSYDGSTKSKKQNWKQEQSSCRYHKIIPFYNNKDKPTEVTIRFNNNYETRLPL